MDRRVPVALVATLATLLPMSPLDAQRIVDEKLFAQSFEAAHQALKFYGEYDNDAELRRVTEIGFQLVEVSAFEDYPFTFHLVEMPIPNAFALPGGQIFLTRGMLKMDLTDDELAGLLGHEIGHVVENHGVRTQKRARLLNVLGQALVIGVLANEVTKDRPQRNDTYYDPYAGSNSSASRVQGAAAASLVTSELLLRGYSREFEDEADATGQRLAALAGFSPTGTASLMHKMSVNIPQSREYGYWSTHPFFEDRVQHAESRSELLTVTARTLDTDLFRAKTQRTLLTWLEAQELEPEALDYGRTVALHTWPQGEAADSIRLTKLHEIRDLEFEKKPLAQDLTTLVADYRRDFENVSDLTPESPLLATLESEISEFEQLRAGRYDEALAIVAGGIYETEFMETFLSNYPDSSEGPRLGLELGEAYSRLGRHTEAVEQYLRTAADEEGGEPAERARRGLTLLATRLADLSALERLSAQSDPAIAEGASRRLGLLVSNFDRVEDGAAYLEAFPEGRYASAVQERLDRLAEDLYGEVVLYQTVGDAAQAVTGIQRILTYAPFSRAADRLRSKMILEG